MERLWPLIKRYMQLSSTFIPPRPAPTEILGTTSYYQWRADDFKARHGEGLEDATPAYYLRYGHKYVQRFKTETRHQLSKKGKNWLDSALLELQLLLESKLNQDPGIEKDAKRLQDFAFRTHAQAYQKAGFFKLPLNDIRLILWTLDFKDSFVNRKGRRQIIEITTRFLETRFLPVSH